MVRVLMHYRLLAVEPFAIDTAYITGKIGVIGETESMRKRVIPVWLMLIASSTYALDAAQLMSALTWQKRVLLVFAPDADHVTFQRQQSILAAIDAGLGERDMTVIQAFADGHVLIGEQGHAQSATGFYHRFAVDSNEFRVILVGKDGTVKLDRDSAVTGDDLFTLIDSMPMRRFEMLQDE